MDVNADTLAEAYFRHRDEDFWAREEVHKAVQTDLNRGWKITLLLLEKAASDHDVGHIAAGPLEDLIDLYGHEALNLIEEECDHNNARLQLALSTVGVMFCYEEFDRWYALLCRYGFRRDAPLESRTVTPKVMQLMNLFLRKTIGAADYEFSMNEWLDRPLDDKRAQQILQAACCDLVRLNDTIPPKYRKPGMLRDSELRARVKQFQAELESLGYHASA